ncbi:hypothetical protein [Methanotorris igneus]|uniref:Uncharacterized protein n=1 Tax=Methanotorris igneus (strain DSM 5666 / JCM 11834 / Kol 5) TaxID=880724 RepID=F6BBK4_METIK|nr:hypothetical protein [Methanotorris igneus]AEF96013.1 hypothetical protein Metig_0457 [Methanotorris igneus Kol 5]
MEKSINDIKTKYFSLGIALGMTIVIASYVLLNYGFEKWDEYPLNYSRVSEFKIYDDTLEINNISYGKNVLRMNNFIKPILGEGSVQREQS